MFGLQLEKINLNNSRDREEVDKFLQKFNLILDKDVDYTIVLRDQQNEIKATCSKAGNVFKCFAVSEELRGENVTSTLITELVNIMFEQGIYHSFIFTKPHKAKVFETLNFSAICETENAVLLEYGISNINKYLNSLIKQYNLNTDIAKGALVMNCNPFTLGHRYLVEKASAQCEQVLLFIVQEDKSLFPFRERYNMVKQGVRDLENVKVIPGGQYIISKATFPSYFIRKEELRTKAYEEIDASIFGRYFCSKLSINKRFVGCEPYCNVTNSYNETLKRILPKYGVELIEIERNKYEQNYISASMVRQLIREDKLNEARYLVPEVTWKFLNSKEGEEVLDKIKKSNSPH
ncbi:MAG: citrate lyase ligase [Clostridiaceae bacterium]|nr:citrate lyase ligase [Clostridiaceae bacterium]